MARLGEREQSAPCYLDDGRTITADLDAPDIIGVFPSSDTPRSALAAALYRVHASRPALRMSRANRAVNVALDRQQAATPALDRQPLVRGRSAGVSGTTVSSCRAAHEHKHPMHGRQRRTRRRPHSSGRPKARASWARRPFVLGRRRTAQNVERLDVTGRQRSDAATPALDG
jgi:hypothetical protein